VQRELNTSAGLTPTAMVARRTVLKDLVAGIGSAALLSGAAEGRARAHATQPREPVVETRYGKVRGTRLGDVYAFKGIRYAAPTGGENRFMPPREPVPWGGIADALEFGNIAPQSNPHPPSHGAPPKIILMRLPHPHGAAPPRPKESEDCLFLNVWTTGLSDGRKRPVMVWLHGGFFAVGSGDIDGANLARSGELVVVSLNHRLNILGYSHFGDIGGPKWAHSGNAGMLDIIAALRWVRDNIDRFGGDPGRVMAFGESGGGMKTSFLMASPPAHRLMDRAGVQSGPGLKMMTRDAATRVSEMVLRELGVAPARLDDLQRLPVTALEAARFAVEAKLPTGQFTDLISFAPVIDPVYLPRQPFSPDAAPITKPIPLLIGSNQTDMIFFMGDDEAGFHLDEADLRARAAKLFDGMGDAVVDVYRRSYPEYTPTDIYEVMFSDFSIMSFTVKEAERKAALGGAPVFLYQFNWRSPVFGGKLKSMHTMEAPFVFNTVEEARMITGGGPKAQALAGRMSGAWAHFAATGDPNHTGSGLPHWPAYDLQTRATMLLDNTSVVKDDPFRAELAVLAKAMKG
jgi:para-nitrobenzyl esterase